MKKWICILLVLTLALTAGCAGKAADPEAPLLPQPEGTPLESITVGRERNVTAGELKGEVKVANISPYSGIYLEGGPALKTREENLYALKITNNSGKTIASITLVYHDGTQELNFYAEMIPADRSIYVVEKDMKSCVSEKLTHVSSEVVYLENAVENMESLQITATRNSTLMIKNITKETLPGAIVYYRKVLEDGTLLGGPVYTTLCEALEPGDEYEAEAEWWQDSSCQVVNILILEITEETTVPDESTSSDSN